ncbi:hypothetical protein DH2020_001939 [Rehmannia glutinosa]|uniref:Response regulatory domain-containing protein n=1 Tax=Rehmannia glutinosa TaxID=99300 RepID=A0ABR0XSP1_REHGL
MKEANYKFNPVGMRILVVDDSKILEDLLRRCQYNVTTIEKASTALQILLENRDKYDLVITESDMADMDGFKLLEEVRGLQMDIPIILVSSSDDKERVMKGILYGACDYLLKPVRIEELKNIWQHVVRRNLKSSKHDQGVKKHCDYSVDHMNKGSDEGVVVVSDQMKEINSKKRNKDEKEEYDDEYYDEEESIILTQTKKPRVVWSSELHHKFVAAVKQLGVDSKFLTLLIIYQIDQQVREC